MIGPTGSARPRSAAGWLLARAPFLKVEATKFTEVGYVGAMSIRSSRDLTDAAIMRPARRMREEVKARDA